MTNTIVYQRKDGRWESRISVGKDENGKRKYRSFYGKSREEAVLKQMIAFQSITEEYAVTELTVTELVTEYLHIMSSRLKESTLANYRMKAEKHIIPMFGNIQCCVLKAKEIYAFIDKKLKEGLSVRYVTDIIVLMKALFRYASREYNIRNALENLVMPKKVKPEIEVLSPERQEKLERFLAKNQSLTSVGIFLSLYMGMRIGEVCALQWGDIDLAKREITVRKTIQRIQVKNGKRRTKLIITEPKSANSMRIIPIPECLVKLLTQYKDSAENFVISGTRKPVEPRTMQYRFVKILHNADLPSVHFHSLRHLFATNCVALGFDIKTLSEILGHSSIEVTLSRYVHSSMDRKRACMDLVRSAA